MFCLSVWMHETFRESVFILLMTLHIKEFYEELSNHFEFDLNQIILMTTFTWRPACVSACISRVTVLILMEQNTLEAKLWRGSESHSLCSIYSFCMSHGCWDNWTDQRPSIDFWISTINMISLVTPVTWNVCVSPSLAEIIRTMLYFRSF
jgi:hypothetical protein